MLVKHAAVNENFEGLISFLRVRWVKTNFSYHEIMLHVMILLELYAQLVNTLCRQVFQSKLRLEIDIAPLKRVVRRHRGILAQSWGEVQV